MLAFEYISHSLLFPLLLALDYVFHLLLFSLSVLIFSTLLIHSVCSLFLLPMWYIPRSPLFSLLCSPWDAISHSLCTFFLVFSSHIHFWFTYCVSLLVLCPSRKIREHFLTLRQYSPTVCLPLLILWNGYNEKKRTKKIGPSEQTHCHTCRKLFLQYCYKNVLALSF